MGGNIPPNGTLLSHHAQPFIPSSLHTPNGLMPIHVNPYSQSSAGLVNGQTPNFPFQTQIGNPSAGGISTYHPQGGYIPQTFTNNGKSTRAFVTRYTDDTLQILGLHEEQRISDFGLVEHLSTDLPSTYKGLMEKNLHLDRSKRSGNQWNS
ncbi:hypothetical protein Tco_1381541 [Tanacetum coccineum]